jgi:hypothetical protein
MTNTYMCLGQINPSASTLSTLYTVPSATSTTVSSLTVCNLSSSPAVFSVSIAIGGASDNAKQYIYSNLAMDGYDTFIATTGFTLAATDVMRVFSSTSNLAFGLYGVQIT